MVIECLNFSSKWIQMDRSWKLRLEKITSKTSKECVLEVGFKYPKKLRELYNHYPSISKKIKIK